MKFEGVRRKFLHKGVSFPDVVFLRGWQSALTSDTLPQRSSNSSIFKALVRLLSHCGGGS